MGRHALLEAPDVPAVTPDAAVVVPETAPADVRTVAEIIAQFRREQGLSPMPSRRSAAADAPAEPTVVVGPWTVPVETTTAASDEHEHDDDRDDEPQPPTGPRPGDTGEIAVRARRDAAWNAALRPTGDSPQPRRRRAASGSAASAVIASLTAELSATHPGLLEGTPHSRRASTPTRSAAKRTAPAGEATSLRPVRVTAGLRGAALRVPALTSGWRVPTRTPLVLAGAVAVSVVVTDQAGLLSNATPEAGADTTAQQQLAANVQANAAAAAAADDAAAAAGAAQARSRVSRLQRSPLPSTASQAVTSAAGGTGTAVGAAPPPDSVMKPGQTVPGDWVRPSPAGIYNSCFCSRWGTFHEGIDFAAPLGSPILAVGDGVVVQAGPASGFGNWVIIKHDNGDMTIYGHMKYYFVKIGQKVKAGQEIALVGREGQSTGPHLHIGVKVGSTNGIDGTYVDPVPWLTARGIDVGVYNQNG